MPTLRKTAAQARNFAKSDDHPVAGSVCGNISFESGDATETTLP